MRALRLVVCLAGVAGVLVMAPIVHRSPDATYGGADLRLLVLEAAAALSLLLVGARRTPQAAAVPVALVGAAWLVPELAGAAGLPLPARTVADASAPVLAATLLLALARPTGRGDTAARRACALAVVGAVVAALARVFLVDPFEQLDCWRTCDHNPLLIGEGHLAPLVQLAGLLAVAGGALWAGLRLGPRRGGAGGDPAGWVLLGGLVAFLFVQPTQVGAAGPEPPGVTVFLLLQSAAVAWVAWLGWEGWRSWRLASRLSRLLDPLRSGPGSEVLAESLRDGVGDPGLRLAYWAPARSSYVDAAGRPTEAVRPGPGERVTTLARHSQTVAAVVHSTRVDGQRLDRALGPALRLALENEQLRAAALAELDELGRSRARVVERSELERRRLERNLHDGAQQRVVSLALMVRLLARQVDPHGDDEACRRAEVLTNLLVAELRRVARGIYPAVLADAGLLGAVEDLAERSCDLAVALGDFPSTRFPGTVESTAYLAVRAGIEDARHRKATTASVRGAQVDGNLRIVVEDDATEPSDGAVSAISDQVGALGGTLASGGAPGRRRVEVVLPCEW